MPTRLTLAGRRVRRWIHALTHGDTLDREHDAEAAFHVEAEAQELSRLHGLPVGGARRRARAAFGGLTQTREAHRHARGVTTVETLAHDVRYSVRALGHARTFSLSAILVLALGIGASTVIFSAVHAVLLSHLPYPQDDRLVRIVMRDAHGTFPTISVVDARAIGTRAHTLSAFGVARQREVAITVGNEPEELASAAADAGFFRALGVQPLVGRAILPSDDVPGAPPVAVVGYGLAVRAYGVPARAPGQTMLVDGAPYTVVGVLARQVGDLAGIRADLWIARQDAVPTRRGPFGLLAVGRLADGTTIDAARRELADLSRRVFPQWAASYQDSTATYAAVPLRTAVLGRAPDTLRLLTAAVAFVLLIVVANVANLTFVRTVGRRRELVLRETLGAARTRVARLLVTESVLLALAGALLGVLLGILGLRVLPLLAPHIPRLDTARIDPAAIGFAIGLAVLAGAAIGLLPAIALLRGAIGRPASDDSRTVSQGRAPVALRGAFVIGQFALALPLLAGAGLLLNSLLRLQQVNPGFDPAHVLTVRLSLPAARYPNDTTIRRFWTQAVARVRALDGVDAVGINTNTPPADQLVCCNNFDLVDHPVPHGVPQPTAPWMFVSPDYFTALGVRLEQGRAFALGDTGSAPPVVAVSASWAHRYFPEGNVVGRHLMEGGCTTCPFTTVVAVVGNVKYMGLDGTTDAVYSPLGQNWGFASTATLFVRTAGTPQSAIPAVRAALRSLDPMVPIDDVVPLASHLADALTSPRHLASLVTAFAAAALLLAAVGIFGMLSYTVSTRRRELGIRLALGAERTSLVGSVVGSGMAYAATGAAIGLAVTVLGIGRLARGTSDLFEVRPTDPPTLLAVAGVLLAVAFLASLLPALRAATTDPLTAIRND